MLLVLLSALLGCAPKKPAVAVPAAPAPSAGLVELRGVATKPPLRELLLRGLATADVTPCYAAALGRDPRAYGEIVVDFTVAASGAVEAASVHLSTLGDAEAEACVLRAVQALRFPGATSECLEVMYPFVFTSDATPPEVARALKVRYGLVPAEPDDDPTDPKAPRTPGVVYLF